MKKLIAAVCLSAVMLCGCSSQTAYLKAYTVATSSQTSDTAAMLHTDAWEGFAANLGVVSVTDSETGINSETLSSISAAEVLLTGTTDNTVITAYNIYTEVQPASITKILTALMLLEYTDDLSQEVTLTDDIYEDESDAVMCGYKAGDVVSLKTLLYTMLTYSGNDAANAIAYAVSGNISDFCEAMTERAHELGATHTNFTTPNGLDSGNSNHYTTAYDLYLIFSECLKYDIFKDAISQSGYTATWTRGEETITEYYESTNYYLLGNKTPPEGISIVGGKTGTTSKAGSCLILYVEDSDENGYISVLMGCADKDTLYSSMTTLLSDIQNE